MTGFFEDTPDRRDPAEQPEPLELPLEMYFAQAPAEDDPAFRQAVLHDVAGRRSFSTHRARSRLRRLRWAVAGSVAAVIGSVALLDRADLAPWKTTPEPGPVASLIDSAGSEAQSIASVAVFRDRITQSIESSVRDSLAAIPDPVAAPITADRRNASLAGGLAGGLASRPGGGGVLPAPRLRTTAGPFFSIEEPAGLTIPTSSAIRFDDGFAFPAGPTVRREAAPASHKDLRWPSATGLAESVVRFDGLDHGFAHGIQPRSPQPTLQPAWYAAAKVQRPAPDRAER